MKEGSQLLLNLVKRLLTAGANLPTPWDKRSQQDLLVYASMCGEKELVHVLLETRRDLVSQNGKNALYQALLNGHFSIADELMATGVRIQDIFDMTREALKKLQTAKPEASWYELIKIFQLISFLLPHGLKMPPMEEWNFVFSRCKTVTDIPGLYAARQQVSQSTQLEQKHETALTELHLSKLGDAVSVHGGELAPSERESALLAIKWLHDENMRLNAAEPERTTHLLDHMYHEPSSKQGADDYRENGTALFLAVKNNHSSLVDPLLKAGADAMIVGQPIIKRNALHFAVMQEDNTIFNKLVTHGVDLQKCPAEADGCTLVTNPGNLQTAEQLIAAKIPLDGMRYDLQLYFEHYSVTRYFLEQKANLPSIQSRKEEIVETLTRVLDEATNITEDLAAILVLLSDVDIDLSLVNAQFEAIGNERNSRPFISYDPSPSLLDKFIKNDEIHVAAIQRLLSKGVMVTDFDYFFRFLIANHSRGPIMADIARDAFERLADSSDRLFKYFMAENRELVKTAILLYGDTHPLLDVTPTPKYCLTWPTLFARMIEPQSTQPASQQRMKNRHV